MFKLNVFNMEAFLERVNTCHGEVYVLKNNGKKENINRQSDAQEYLRRKHQVNKGYSRLSLEITDPTDYMGIVSYNIGNF